MDTEALSRLAADFLEVVDCRILSAAERLREKGREIVCGPGCSTCCRLPVMATLPEGMLAARHIAAELAPVRSDGLRIALNQWAAWSRGPLVEMLAEGTDPVRAYLYHGPGCPFLDDGLCAIYPVRPLACRVHSSVKGPEVCMPPETELPVFFNPGSVREVNEAVRPAVADYMRAMDAAGLDASRTVEPFPLITLSLL